MLWRRSIVTNECYWRHIQWKYPHSIIDRSSTGRAAMITRRGLLSSLLITATARTRRGQIGGVARRACSNVVSTSRRRRQQPPSSTYPSYCYLSARSIHQDTTSKPTASSNGSASPDAATVMVSRDYYPARSGGWKEKRREGDWLSLSFYIWTYIQQRHHQERQSSSQSSAALEEGEYSLATEAVKEGASRIGRMLKMMAGKLDLDK